MSTSSDPLADVCRRFCSNDTHDDACVTLHAMRGKVLQEAAEHLRDCSKRWDGGTVGRFPILRHRWRDALRNGVAFAAMELDQMAREED